MTESVHGHDVMQMMLETGKEYTEQTLRQDIHKRFGADARFHTCSRSDMDAAELIVFLQSKGKFSSGKDGFQTHPDRICRH